MKYGLETIKEILRVRLSQMLINEKYKEGAFKIPIHLALGHEAIAVAVDSVMGGNDQLVLSHRNIHYNLARTKSLKPELDEYLLRKEGLAQGQLGAMNLANDAKNVIYTSSILGNNFSVAAGLSLGKKVKNDYGVVFVVTGDGAMEEGTFYEGLEFMKSNSLPVVIIVENNCWSLATKIEERRCDIHLQKFGNAMDVRYERLSGNNAADYIEKLNDIRAYVAANRVPALVEVSLTTLGYWRVKSDDNPEGRFINYHAGPAPEVNILSGPVILDSEEDPAFVAKSNINADEFEKISKEVLEELKREIE